MNSVQTIHSLEKKEKNNWKIDSTINSWPLLGVWAYLEPSRRPVLLEALAAVNRPTLCRLEGNLVLLPAVRTRDLCHLTRATVVSTAPFSITQYFHSYSVCMLRTPCGIPRTLPSLEQFFLLNPVTHRALETGKTCARYLTNLPRKSAGLNCARINVVNIISSFY